MGLAIARTRPSEWSGHARDLNPKIFTQPNFVCHSAFLHLILSVVLGSACCYSQTASTGALIGEVLDPSGKAIIHASVEARDPDAGISRSALTNEEGSFALPLLPPGTYWLVATKADYSQAQSISVQVLVTESIRISILMKVAGITQRIEVQANVSQLQRPRLDVSSTIARFRHYLSRRAISPRLSIYRRAF
jgi:hypothetical protein